MENIQKEDKVVEDEKLDLILQEEEKLNSIISKLDIMDSELENENFIPNKIIELEEIIKGLPDRAPKTDGNIIMKTHIENIVNDLKIKPNDYIYKCKSNISLTKESILLQKEKLLKKKVDLLGS